ncbi:SpaH/EbpB family LPXTG-anchored major pilin [Streptococcus sp. S784/96/1]|uniref:SpaH/EbpB family LPXTG-anchored major pilin n=1 Tax=Streptococcus sp. S784/96/1 TaxID=2653499 RepID=UPI0013894E02|nr:SpaH/EbpB family LPXTG-anchored major pilin [Streptococcus sp. S784/96/1]
MKKKIIKSILAATLILGTVVPATTPVFAADTGTITINGTQKGTYTAYKIFDATVADSTIENGSVSYTLPKGSPLLEDTEFNNLFEKTGEGDLVYITRKPGVDDKAITDWAQKLNLQDNPQVVVEDGADTTAVLNVGYGYYVVKSSIDQASVVMVTSVSPNAIINEKNSKPTWGDKGGKTTDSKTYNVGDTITYKITYQNATNYNSGEKVYQYVLKDDMPEANIVELVNDSFVVKVNGVALNLTTDTTSATANTYRLEKDGNDFTLTIPWAGSQTPTLVNGSTGAQRGDRDDFFYEDVNEITVEYKGILKADAAEGSNTANTNTARITPNEAPKPSDPGKSVNVYDGEINIKKVDGIDMNKTLAGAKFVLRRKEDSKYYKFDEENQTTLWIDNLNEATVKETDNQGVVKFTGLAEGSYDLIETVAPKGYNLLKEPTSVTLTFKEGATGSADTLIVESTVKNNRGAELPSTGSFGTKLLYIVGTTLVIAAGVTLVARRRAED